MKVFRHIIQVLEQEGYNPESDDLAEFWFSNYTAVSRNVERKYPGQSNGFELVVRWKTPMGKAAQEALRHYLHEEQQIILKRIDDGKDAHRRLHIEFSNFYFEFEGEVLTLKDVEHRFKTSNLKNFYDLRGLDLSNIRIKNIEFERCAFNYASFQNSSIDKVDFHGCNLAHSEFRDARLTDVVFDDNCLLDYVDFSGAILSHIDQFSNSNLKHPPVYREIPYFGLLKYAAIAAWTTKNPLFAQHKKNSHTIFVRIDFNDLDRPATSVFANYLHWYQLTINQLGSMGSISLQKRWLFVFSVLFTKNWSSYSVLASMAFLINLFFSSLYSLFHNHFENLEGNWFSCFYYSVVTFTTLGYGDIVPLTHLGRLLVIIEVFTGFVMSGIFIFLVGHLVGKRM